jgi:hypothetical protein
MEESRTDSLRRQTGLTLIGRQQNIGSNCRPLDYRKLITVALSWSVEPSHALRFTLVWKMIIGSNVKDLSLRSVAEEKGGEK